MNELNDYCLLHIFQYFSPTDKLIIEKVCIRWQYLIQRLWQQMLKLQFEDGRNLYKKKCNLVSYCTIRDIIFRCGKFVRHIDLENMIEMDKFLAVHFGAYTYKILVSSFTIVELLETLAKYCNSFITLFLNTKTVPSRHMERLLESNKTLLKVKICGIDNKTVIDNYLELLPDCLEKLDLFFIDCQLQSGLYDLIRRSPNLTDLRCVCYEANCVDGLTEGILQAIGNYAMYLSRLHLRQMDARVSEYSIQCITSLSNLTYLKLERFDNVITDNVVTQITLNCKKLEFISFCGCPNVSNSGMNSIFTSLPKLENVEIFHSNISELLSENYVDTIPNLKRLYITNCPNLSQDTLCKVIDVSPNITTLFISQCFLERITISFAILTTISRNKTFILKKWKSFNVLPFKVIINKVDNAFSICERSSDDRNFRLLIYDNGAYDHPDISTPIHIALFVQKFVSANLKNCKILQ